MKQTVNLDKFEIKTKVFEGPLELLLDLVEKRKLLINDISLAEVTDEYIKRVSVMQKLSLPNTSQFINLAATLLLIKSKSLLPVLTLTYEEEEDVGDLERRLKKYQIYRNIANDIENMFGKTTTHERQYVGYSKSIFVTDNFTTLDVLTQAIDRVLENLPKKKIVPKVKIRKIISLQEMITKLNTRIESQIKLTLRDLLEKNTERDYLVIGFLAILESVKQENIIAVQINHFDDIEIEHKRTQIPRYQ